MELNGYYLKIHFDHDQSMELQAKSTRNLNIEIRYVLV